jgi:AcrR family transcriptional regulator
MEYLSLLINFSPRRVKIKRSKAPFLYGKVAMSDERLKLRVEPVQMRAKGTIDLILEITAQLLEEVGNDVLTTKLIAERAGIRVRNVYRYFRNKQAVILALAQRMAREQYRFTNDFEQFANPDIEWTIAVDTAIDSFVQGFAFQSGMHAIRKAMQSTPELREVDEQLNRDLAHKLSKALKKRGASIPQKRMHLVCLVILDVATCLLDRAGLVYAESKDISRALDVVQELKEIIKSYLGPYIK